jgi:Rad3-related DNA helicase
LPRSVPHTSRQVSALAAEAVEPSDVTICLDITQWVGRGIRTTTDRASITLFDTRVVTAKYGKQILRGLPPLPLVNEGEVR